MPIKSIFFEGFSGSKGLFLGGSKNTRDGDASDETNIENNTALGGALIGEQLYTRHSDHTQAIRHGGKGNYIMLDGHVKTLSPEAVSPAERDDDPAHPCPGCADQVNPNAQAFWNIVQ